MNNTTIFPETLK